MPKRSSTTSDVNQIARRIMETATGNPIIENSSPIATEKNQAAVALGRLGGLKGGKARAATLSSKRRSEIALKAAQTRWAKKAAQE